MLPRFVLAFLLLPVLGGFALAETYRGLLIELTDSKVSILALVKGEKKGEKKVLNLAAMVRVIQQKEDGKEKLLPFAEIKKLLAVAAKGRKRPTSGLLVSVSTDEVGRVVAIDLGKSGLPDKVAEILNKADRIELYSLEPEPDPKAAKDPKATLFRGYLVLGKTTIKEGKERKAAQLMLDVSAGRGRVARCFDPRHAIRATHGDKTVDMV